MCSAKRASVHTVQFLPDFETPQEIYKIYKSAMFPHNSFPQQLKKFQNKEPPRFIGMTHYHHFDVDEIRTRHCFVNGPGQRTPIGRTPESSVGRVWGWLSGRPEFKSPSARPVGVSGSNSSRLTTFLKGTS